MHMIRQNGCFANFTMAGILVISRLEKIVIEENSAE
jgi:hypothetical protein